MFNTKPLHYFAVTVLFVVYGYLLFKNLGQYHFWDDEANTAIYARNLLDKGELNAFDGRNLIGYSNGIELDENLNNVIIPPLQYYMAAASFWLLGETTFAARFPFALLGLLGFWVFYLINRQLFKNKNLVLVNLLIFATNIAFVLYMRQSRYYAPMALFFLVNVLFLILYHKRPSWFLLVGYVVSSVLLFLSQYNAALAALSVLALAYFYINKWKINNWNAMAFIVANSVIVLLIAVYLYYNNPFGNAESYSGKGFNIGYKLYVFYRSLVSFDTFSLLSFPLVLLFIYFNRKFFGSYSQTTKLLLLFLVANIFGFSVFAIKYAFRYLVYLIPLALMIEGYIAYRIWHWPTKHAKTLSTIVVVLLVFTSGLYISDGWEAKVEFMGLKVNSHLIDYTDEIHQENPTAYSQIIDYLKAKTEKDRTVYVHPVYMSCPLMFYLGDKYLFVNQIGKEKDIDVELPNYVYNYAVSPDYIIICGPDILKKNEIMGKYTAQYQLEKNIDFYYRDVTRPEYEWRNFDVVKDYNKTTETIFVFKKIDVAG